MQDLGAIFVYAPDFLYVVPDSLKGLRLGSITTPSDRLANVYEWHTETNRVWNFLAQYTIRKKKKKAADGRCTPPRKQTMEEKEQKKTNRQRRGPWRPQRPGARPPGAESRSVPQSGTDRRLHRAF